MAAKYEDKVDCSRGSHCINSRHSPFYLPWFQLWQVNPLLWLRLRPYAGLVIKAFVIIFLWEDNMPGLLYVVEH